MRTETDLQQFARLLAAVYNEPLPADIRPGPAYDVDGLYVRATASASSSCTDADNPAAPPNAGPQEDAGGAAWAGDPPPPAQNVDLDALRARLPLEYSDLDEPTLRAIAAALYD